MEEQLVEGLMHYINTSTMEQHRQRFQDKLENNEFINCAIYYRLLSYDFVKLFCEVELAQDQQLNDLWTDMVNNDVYLQRASKPYLRFIHACLITNQHIFVPDRCGKYENVTKQLMKYPINKLEGYSLRDLFFKRLEFDNLIHSYARYMYFEKLCNRDSRQPMLVSPTSKMDDHPVYTMYDKFKYEQILDYYNKFCRLKDKYRNYVPKTPLDLLERIQELDCFAKIPTTFKNITYKDMVFPAQLPENEYKNALWMGTIPYILTSLMYVVKKHAPIAGLLAANINYDADTLRCAIEARHRYNETEESMANNKLIFKKLKGLLSNPNIRFIIIPLILVPTGAQYKHANVCIYDKHTYRMEMFDPQYTRVECEPLKENFVRRFDKELRKYSSRDLEVKTTSTLRFTMPQDLQIRNANVDYESYMCVVWSAWFADFRISNPDKSFEYLTSNMMKFFKNEMEITAYIRGYAHLFQALTHEIYMTASFDVLDKFIKLINDK